ncbi:hypothetical protein KOW79_019785 [Hemibagrus wyckioides]|uniref:C2H2-type domain-containing protein n=1 Tax=Hemibagrus wyckioides TaxID=337641 RepID=A0A9D3N7M5_9TELE|nr:hypothetical protein KOW79_019785 [Hemibagrus wyckioides]
MEEDEDEVYVCGGTSNSLQHLDQQRRYQMEPVKEEESEDEFYLCTTEMNSTHLQTFSCSWCSFSYTSETYLHKHIRRCHYEEYQRLVKLREIKDETISATLNV